MLTSQVFLAHKDAGLLEEETVFIWVGFFCQMNSL